MTTLYPLAGYKITANTPGHVEVSFDGKHVANFRDFHEASAYCDIMDKGSIYSRISGFMAATQDEMHRGETIDRSRKLAQITAHVSELADQDKDNGFASNIDLIAELHHLHMVIENYPDAF